MRETELRELELKREETYKMQHTAPSKKHGVRADNLTEAFSDDIYSSNAHLYHGHGGAEQTKEMDKKAIHIIQSIKDNPCADITIYRAIPSKLDVDIY